MKLIILAILAVGSVGATVREEKPRSLAECVLCTYQHLGTCGCQLGTVVCCDGYKAWACGCD